MFALQFLLANTRFFTRVSLAGLQLNDLSTASLFSSLQTNPSVQWIRAEACGVHAKGLERIEHPAEDPELFQGLKYLALSGNGGIGDKGCGLLARLLQHSSQLQGT